MLWPPPRTELTMRCSRANCTARTTSTVPLQRAISAGRRSIIAFQTWRTSSYGASSAASSVPRNAALKA